MAKEYIERKKLSNACYDIYGETVRAWQSMSASEVKELMHRFEKAIQAIPAADVVEVVRCKDCKHWHEHLGWCDKHSHFIKYGTDGEEFCHPWESAEWKMFDADYWCADGERRDNNAAD